MAVPASNPLISVEDYLAGERETEVRHEYVSGYVYAMGGASARHNVLAGNLFAALHGALAESPCEVFMADMKVRLKVGVDDVFFYPDVMVCCDPEDRDEYFRSNPCLIVEVLSPTTERTDRREKLIAYTRIDSLREYLLVDQDKRELTLRRRRNDWAAETVHADGALRLECADLELSLAAVYAKSGLE